MRARTPPIELPRVAPSQRPTAAQIADETATDGATLLDVEEGQAGRRAKPIQQPDDQAAEMRQVLGNVALDDADDQQRDREQSDGQRRPAHVPPMPHGLSVGYP